MLCARVKTKNVGERSPEVLICRNVKYYAQSPVGRSKKYSAISMSINCFSLQMQWQKRRSWSECCTAGSTKGCVPSRLGWSTAVRASVQAAPISQYEQILKGLSGDLVRCFYLQFQCAALSASGGGANLWSSPSCILLVGTWAD